ncbi:group 1 glycosyl transferase [Paenibacillus sp. FSL R7-277]|uniref:glycosyltransferase n=1 Tax=unclassified Paenibacillus TaxID=185978 RepID=UPI0003E23035|nr:glycosyltransferase [Paenibacillus sp. FSL R7-277]ETT72226.1 group 1 glycosyl transferase [Paenibacillus sp. FSL R7-277]
MRERMLFLSARSHTPGDREGDIRTENFLNMLLERFDIDLLEYCYHRRETQILRSPALTVHQVKRPASTRRSLLFPLNRLRKDASMIGNDKSLRAVITEMCSQHAYSHVFVSYAMLGNGLDLVASLLPGAVIVTDARRAGGIRVQSRAAGKRGISTGYRKLNDALIRREERRLMNKTSLLLAASEDEALSFKALSFADAGKVHVVPPYINLSAPPYAAAGDTAKDNSIVLHWNMYSTDGKNAALLFFKKVYPLIRAAVPDIRCCIISREVHAEVAAAVRNDSSILIISEAIQTADYIRRARAVVASCCEDCGAQSSILEAWALRTPVVSSLKGSEELLCEPGRNILLAGTTADTADHLIRLLTTPELGSIIADQAYRTLSRHYAADGVKAKLLSLV